MKYFATFGSDQLQNFNVNPMKVMLTSNNEHTLRTRLQKPPFNNNYCTTYPIERASEMIKKYNMQLYTIEELLKLQSKEN